MIALLPRGSAHYLLLPVRFLCYPASHNALYSWV